MSCLQESLHTTNQDQAQLSQTFIFLFPVLAGFNYLAVQNSIIIEHMKWNFLHVTDLNIFASCEQTFLII